MQKKKKKKKRTLTTQKWVVSVKSCQLLDQKEY